jgi:hypothetical protein
MTPQPLNITSSEAQERNAIIKLGPMFAAYCAANRVAASFAGGVN